MDWAVLLPACWAALVLGVLWRSLTTGPNRTSQPNEDARVHPAVQGATPAAAGALSYDGLVQHYVTTGVIRPRLYDQLPFDRPLAPSAPKPKRVPISALVATLPTFPVADRLVGG